MADTRREHKHISMQFTQELTMRSKTTPNQIYQTSKWQNVPETTIDVSTKQLPISFNNGYL